MSEFSLPSSSAGPSSFVASASIPPPPEAIQKDDYAAADQARQRFAKRGLFSSVSLPNFPLRRHNSKTHKRNASLSLVSIDELGRSASVPPNGPDLVTLAEDPNLSAELDEDYDKDVYRWAVMYENQRG